MLQHAVPGPHVWWALVAKCWQAPAAAPGRHRHASVKGRRCITTVCGLASISTRRQQHVLLLLCNTPLFHGTQPSHTSPGLLREGSLVCVCGGQWPPALAFPPAACYLQLQRQRQQLQPMRSVLHVQRHGVA